MGYPQAQFGKCQCFLNICWWLPEYILENVLCKYVIMVNVKYLIIDN